jgi:hypothetical protein
MLAINPEDGDPNLLWRFYQYYEDGFEEEITAAPDAKMPRSRPPIDARCHFSFRQLISMRTAISFSSWALRGANLFYVIEGRNIVRCNRQLKSQTVQPLAVGIAEWLLFPKLPLDNVRRRLVIDLQQLVEPQSVPEFPRQSKGRGSPFCRDRELRLRENECNLTTESFAVLAIYYRGKYTHCLPC